MAVLVTAQKFHTNKNTPCPACGGIVFYNDKRSCVSCVRRENGKKVSERQKDRDITWNTQPQGRDQDVRSGKFKEKEAQIMKVVWYG